MTEANKKAQEEMLHKHAEERNRLIQESNKGTDEKVKELQAKFDALLADKEALEAKLE